MSQSKVTSEPNLTFDVEVETSRGWPLTLGFRIWIESLTTSYVTGALFLKTPPVIGSINTATILRVLDVGRSEMLLQPGLPLQSVALPGMTKFSLGKGLGVGSGRALSSNPDEPIGLLSWSKTVRPNFALGLVASK